MLFSLSNYCCTEISINLIRNYLILCAITYLFCRVMVLDQGKIVEFEPPSVLLTRKNSIFYSMAKDAKLA